MKFISKLISVLAFSGAAVATQAAERPNVIIVFIDDFRALITHGHMYGVSMGYQRIWEEGLERGVDAVMFGHTHRPMLEEDEDLILLNPGSLSYPRQKGRQRSYIVMEKENGKKPTFEIRYLDE